MKKHQLNHVTRSEFTKLLTQSVSLSLSLFFILFSFFGIRSPQSSLILKFKTNHINTNKKNPMKMDNHAQ